MTRLLGWTTLAESMRRFEVTGESTCMPLLELVEPLRTLLGRIIDRSTGIDSDRPQDYVACIVAVRAYRLAISAIRIALSGYPDSCPNLNRTIWEILVRLLDLTEFPVPAAFGHLLQGTFEELAAARKELEHRERGCQPIGHLRENIQTIEDHFNRLLERARACSLEPVKVQQVHGRLNFREVCKRNGIEKVYLVNYAFDSGHVHEKNWATQGFLLEQGGERFFVLGPIPGAGPSAVADSIQYVGLVIRQAALVVGDTGIAQETEAILKDIERRIAKTLEERNDNPQTVQ